MIDYRSKTSTHGRNMAGARSLWRATGMTDNDFGKPIIAVVNSFTQFVPGHVHLKDLGQLVAREIEAAGGVAKEFNTIAVDDGIAMGHGGMLYSLPSRDLIADSVEYMVNAHCADAMICISNCDKITPGMLMATMRLNIPTIFVSGGPMEAGKLVINGKQVKADLIDPMVQGASPTSTDEDVLKYEQSACPTCGSCSGMFSANSMNCLAEAMGLALPGNGSLLATHSTRKNLFVEAGHKIVDLCKRYYEQEDTSVLPRQIGCKTGFDNAMAVDIAMGGSTNSILHILAMAEEGEIDFTITDIENLSRKVPHLSKLSPSTKDYYMEDFHRAGGILGLMGELERAGLIDPDNPCIHAETIGHAIDKWDIRRTDDDSVKQFYLAAPGNVRTTQGFSQSKVYDDLDVDRESGCIRSVDHPYSADGGLAVLYGNICKDGSVVKTAGVESDQLVFSGPAVVCESQEETIKRILGGDIKPGDVVVVRYEGPKGGPGMQEMLYPTSYIKSMGLGKVCALITDGRFSGGSSGLSIGHISPEAAEGGLIGLIQDGDIIEIDINKRILNLAVNDTELTKRRDAMNALNGSGWKPRNRDRVVSQALQAYGLLATSAARGAVRDIRQVRPRGSE